MKYVKYLPALLVLLGLTVAVRLIGGLFAIEHWSSWVRNNNILFYSNIVLVILVALIVLIAPYSKAAPILNRPFAAMPSGLKRLLRIAIAVVIVGVLFKIQHWKGADIELIIGLSSLAIIFMAWMVVLAAKVNELDNKPKR